jgi:hypothetical protein
LAAPEPPRPPALAPTKSSSATRKYFVWALYPRVICYDPGELIVGLTMDVNPSQHPDRDRPPTDLSVLARQERFYKLSSLRSSPFRHPLWCSVKYGPWTAAVTETESCLDGVPNRWEIPAFPSLTVVMGSLALSSQGHSCCPGFQWCQTTQSCVPLQVTCQDPISA